MRPPTSRFPASLNVTGKDKYSETMDSPQLFLVLSDIKYEYCLYRICEPENTDDESTILKLGKPFLKMEKSAYPRGMSFVPLGTSIYMVGGYDYSGGNGDYLPSNHTFICDTHTLSKAIVPGPKLVSGQVKPVLLTLGSKIYALSSMFFSYSSKHGKPGLQVLDTDNLERGWSLLPAPPLRFRGDTIMCRVAAYAAVDNKDNDDTCSSTAIFITFSNDPGTYAFDVDNKVWDYVSQVDLPFSHYAMPMPMPSPPNLPLYCAFSTKSQSFSAFRFWYNAKNRKFRVDQIKIRNSSPVSWKLPPDLYYATPLTALDRFGRVYSIEIGIDDMHADEDPTANHYVKVNAAQVCQIEPNKMKISHIRNDEKENDENVRLNGGMLSKKRIRDNEVVVEDRGEFKMNKRWSSSFFGGPMPGLRRNIPAAFAL